MLKKALESVSREVNSSSGTIQHSFSDSATPRHSIFKAKRNALNDGDWAETCDCSCGILSK